MGTGQKYVLVNRSSYNVQVIIPAPLNSRRNAACLIVQASCSVDILPYAGTRAACRRIPYINDLVVKGIIEIVEE
jgi:hypothetical protein